jgi:diketogulonate reductase-like aldo/keto reductase
VHWPPGGQAAPEVWQEVVRAQQDGLVTSVGVSNYSLEQIDEITRAVGVPPAVNQIKWGPLLYDVAEVDGLRERGVVLEGYSPLKATDLEDPVLRDIAETQGVTPAQVVIAWHVAHGFVVIPKSTRRERIIANAEAVPGAAHGGPGRGRRRPGPELSAAGPHPAPSRQEQGRW